MTKLVLRAPRISPPARRRARHVLVLTTATALMLGACAGTPAKSDTPSPVAIATKLPSSPPVAPPSPATCTPSEPIELGEGEEWIVFQSLADQFGPERCNDNIAHDDTIFLARPDGSRLHRLAPDSWVGSEIRPTWSPDGNRIAFIRAHLPNDRSELWVINADGTGAELLYTCAGSNVANSDCNTIGDPDWWPDGNAVAFGRDSNIGASGIPETFEILRYDLATGTAGPVLTREDGMTVEQPRISPDGKMAVYVRFRNLESPDSDSALFYADLKTGQDHQVTDWSLHAGDPDWSVDGRLAFNSWDLRAYPTTTEAVNLFTIEWDGSDLRQLTQYGTSDTRAAQPRWTSDGSRILYTLVTRVSSDPYGERHLAIVDADGGFGGDYPTKALIIGTHPEPRP